MPLISQCPRKKFEWIFVLTRLKDKGQFKLWSLDWLENQFIGELSELCTTTRLISAEDSQEVLWQANTANRTYMSSIWQNLTGQMLQNGRHLQFSCVFHEHWSLPYDLTQTSHLPGLELKNCTCFHNFDILYPIHELSYHINYTMTPSTWYMMHFTQIQWEVCWTFYWLLDLIYLF